MLANTTILIVRHAEKPARQGNDDSRGPGLSPAGQRRAEQYVDYFQPYRASSVDGTESKAIAVDRLFAAADTNSSHRSRLTLEPLAAARGLPLRCDLGSKGWATLVSELTSDAYDNTTVLICWRHGTILKLANALLAPRGGAAPTPQLGSRWPAVWHPGVFGWLLQICFDGAGIPDLRWVRCLSEKLMPGDTVDPPGPSVRRAGRLEQIRR